MWHMTVYKNQMYFYILPTKTLKMELEKQYNLPYIKNTAMSSNKFNNR